MSSKNHRESFIPYPRQDIIHLCLTDGNLDQEAIRDFQTFCDILTAFFHFQFHSTLEQIKANYQVFNPNADVQPLYEPALQDYEQMSDQVVQAFKTILEKANYLPISKDMIHEVVDTRSLIKLKTSVDFDDFEQVLCYYRGNSENTIQVKQFFWGEKQQTIQFFERLVLLLKFKGEGYFHTHKNRKKRQVSKQNFIPGKIYLFFHKNLPKPNLSLLFPNLQTSMPLKDKLLFAVPLTVAAAPIAAKLFLHMLLLLAAFLALQHPEIAREILQKKITTTLDIVPSTVAFLTILIAFVGFAMHHYKHYKATTIQFQKDVTDTLFFKNLANNAGVFQMLVDIAEEEECKEIILVYYHLLISPVPLTPEELDVRIETWLLEKTGTSIDFDIHSPLKTLQSIRGLAKSSSVDQSLLSYDDQGRCKVLPLKDAKIVLDYVWDSVFRYNN
jgi:hypothetical protein